MRTFITGVAGFAGSHLAELLLKEGEEVFGLVRDKKNCENLRNQDDSIFENLDLFEGNILDFDRLCNIISEVKPDEIYHLAAISNVPYSLAKPDLTFEVNFEGTRKLFDAVLKSGQTPKILFVGSADAYGDISSDDLPIYEKCPFRPVSPYGLSKASADLLAFQYFKGHGLPILRARPFNHIGPRQNSGFVCSGFAKQVACIEVEKENPVLFTGNLKAEKDFLNVRDVVRAYRLILRHGEDGEVFNICRGESYSIDFILNELIEMSGEDIEVRQDPKRFRQVEIPKIFGDCSTLKSRTGWQPSISLKESLREVLDYHRNLLT